MPPPVAPGLYYKPDHAVITISSDIGSTLHYKFLTMPALVANYFVEQGRGIFRGACAIAPPPPLGRQ